MDERGLGNRLQLARKSAGLTQQMLCQKANLSYSTLAKIERGAIKSPSIFTIQSIADALGTSLDELIGADGPRKNNKKRSKTGVSFVYFDVNGCLVHFFQSAFTKLSAATGQPADIIETIFWHYNDAVCRGEMKVEEFNKKFSKQLKVPTINWSDYYFEAINPVPEVGELIQWVSSNYRIGLLTNTMPGFLNELMKRDLVPNINYDAVVDSSKVGAIKPEAKIYKIAQEMANAKAAEILLVDDSRSNLMAAEKTGWRVSWFDDYNSKESIARIRQSLEIDDTPPR
jgi:FMN phosphatase YigB (HAD superfamily)